MCLIFSSSDVLSQADDRKQLQEKQQTDTIRQVVVTGQFRPQPVDKSIYHIDVIDSRQIRQKAANNLGDLLKTELSFQYNSADILGDFVRIRGLSGEHIKILIDGIPVTGRVADWIDLGQLTLQHVDHIEIIEGPMSVIYGSNALAGAINIITADYSDVKFHASANGYYETVGAYNLNLELAKNIKNHTFSIHGARNFFSGWDPVDTSRYKNFKPKLQYMTGLTYQYHRNKLKFTLNSDFLNEELRDPGALSLENLYEKALDSYQFTTRWNNRAHFMNIIDKDFVINLEAGYSYYKKRRITYLNDLVNLRKTPAEDPELHDTTRFQLYTGRGFISNITGRKFEYQAGFDVNYETAVGKRTGGNKEISDVAGFMNFIYRPIKLLSFQPGLRLMHNSNYKAPLVYGLSFKLDLDPFTLKANYARGFRAPSLRQLYLHFKDNNHEIYGNENLKAETADNISFSLNYFLSRNVHAFDFELNMFYNAIQNAIQLALSEVPGQGKYFNVEGLLYKTKGMELSFSYRHSPGFSLTAGLLATGRLRLDDPDRFSWSTDFVSTAGYRFKKPDIQLALFYKYTDEYLEFLASIDTEGNPNGIAQTFVSGYHMLDATISRDFFKEHLNVSAGLKNILNVTSVNSLGNLTIHGSMDNTAIRGYGRTCFINLRYTFKQ
jgi:outer membrane receptor for ferrienterochelin and colicins